MRSKKAYIELCRDDVLVMKSVNMMGGFMEGGMGGSMRGGMGSLAIDMGVMGGGMGGFMGDDMSGGMGVFMGTMGDGMGGLMSDMEVAWCDGCHGRRLRWSYGWSLGRRHEWYHAWQ